MRWLGVGVVGALTLVACAPSSGGQCSSTGSLEISLADTNSEAPICDATVTLTPTGGSAQTLADEGKGPGCYYFIMVTPGQYTVLASATGYLSLSEPLTVTPKGCTVQSPMLALELAPAM